MTHDKFIKLASGTREDFIIACDWLVRNHDPVEYIETHGNVDFNTPNCTKSIAWREDWDFHFPIGNNIYYKYQEYKYIVKSDDELTVTDHNYDSTAEVIYH